MHKTSLIGRRLPASRCLLIAGILALAPCGTATPAFAASTGNAMSSLIASANAADSSGQGQATYGASAPTSSPATPAPSVATPGGAMPMLTDRNTAPTKTTTVTTTAATPAVAVLPPPDAAVPPPSSARTTGMPVTSSNGIDIPSPPPPSAFSNDPNQLAAQAEAVAVQAQAQADLDQQKREQEHNAKSFDKASSGLLPLAPDQVRDFMHKLEQTQNAAQFPYEGTPKGQTRISTLSLDPGVEPPQVNLATGYVTTITMVDATGEPWPILDVGVGGNFEVSPTQAGTHIVRIMPLTRVGVGDLSVLLKDLPTPVIFRLSSGGPTVDLRYDARIGKAGPGAKQQIISRPRLEAGDETLTMILENAPPGSAKRLKVGGLDARTKAWSVGDKVYVRTPLSMLSPAWNASVASADGTNVYEIGNAPVLLMSDNGAMVRAQISRDEDHDK